MSLSADHAQRLRHWQVPTTRHEYTRRDTALYALSVGYGENPLDRRELRFIDHARPDFCAVPSLALILAYPGFWLGEPDTGLDIGRILHIEQAIEIVAPLPPSGHVSGHTSVTDLFDLGEGKGAIIRSRRDIRDGNGCTIAIVRQAHMLRGYGGFGGKRSERPAATQDSAPDWEVETKVLPQQALLYRLNGDLNPIHADPEFAARSGFGQPILHGMCSFGMSCRAILRSLCDHDPARLRSIDARMTSPVYPGDTLRHVISRDGSFATEIIGRGKLALDGGKAVIIESGLPVASHYPSQHGAEATA